MRRGRDQHATKSVAGACYTKSVAHATKSVARDTKSEAHAMKSVALSTVLFFAILELKLVSKIFGCSCLTDLRKEASPGHF